jgi:hypothetical protein
MYLLASFWRYTLARYTLDQTSHTQVLVRGTEQMTLRLNLIRNLTHSLYTCTVLIHLFRCLRSSGQTIQANADK